ncbi:MAG: FAD:protein transferase [Baekduia sp.]|nr:FAD:protein transferase [Baekduia sp.]
MRPDVHVEQVMGLPVEIDVRDRDVAADAADAAFAELRWVDEVFSTYRPDSQISRLGRGELTIADCVPEVDEVLTHCAELHDETNGYFSVRPFGTLDPSGLVKGWAIARAGVRLRERGARNFLINAGGDVLACGRPEPGARWRVGIRHPIEGGALAAALEVEDLAVATSGLYERGEHIADPRGGRAAAGLLSVTVVGPDIATADAYATAIFAMGEAGPAFAARLTGMDALCITAGREVLSTAGMDRYRVT